MISAVAWVPKGASKPTLSEEPTEAELLAARAAGAFHGGDGDGDEDDGMDEDSEWETDRDSDSDAADESMEEAARSAAAQARAAAASITSDKGGGKKGPARGSDALEAAMKELDMDNYDDDDVGGPESLMRRVLGGRNNVATDEDGDPYITLDDPGSESEAEAEDFVIKPTDLVVLAARNEDDVSNLEVWVYEEPETADDDANIYVHHDIMLPSFPLSLAWMNCDPNGVRSECNMIAVGTLEPGIEIWDLDVVDAVEPVATLGGEDKEAAKTAPQDEDSGPRGTSGAAKKKKKKKKAMVPKKVVVPGSHSDSVLGLSWNREYRNVLASGSADTTVKVWDVSKQVCEHTLTHHKGKVQAVAWNPVESPVLLTGSFDKTACLVDVRAPGGEPVTWKVSADVEALTWHPNDPTCFMVSAEDGLVACFDARKGAGSDPVYRLAAHDAPTCGLSFSVGAPGLLATCSTDKKVKLWDVSAGSPALVASQDLQLTAVFTVNFCPESPCLLAVGGAQGGVVVWDVSTVASVTSKWPQLKRKSGKK